MMIIRRSLSGALLVLALSALAGCEVLSSDYWHQPSPLSTQPPPPPPNVKHEKRGGFAVLVGAPGQPNAARVFADIAAFAQERGFTRQSGNPPPPDTGVPSAPDRYSMGDITLDVSYQSAAFQVAATLHSFGPKLTPKFVNQFYQDFRQQYGTHYGSEPPMFKSDL